MPACAAGTRQLSSGEEIRVISYTTTYRERGRGEEGRQVDTQRRRWRREESARCWGTEEGLGEEVGGGGRQRKGGVME